MSRDIKESDWKIFRELRELALDRFCRRVLDQVGAVACDPAKSNHERYGAVYKVIHEQDKELAALFDGASRSVAMQQIAGIRLRGLVTDEEFTRFSPEMRQQVESFTRIMQG